jgi:predicted Zn-dependent protease
LILHDQSATPARAAEAEAETRESLRLSPHNPLADAQLGQILLDRGDTAGALALFEDARARTPNDPKLLRLLARAYGRQGKTAQAAALAAQAQALLAAQNRADVLAAQARATPLNLSLHQQLAALYARIGQPEKARQEADTVRLLQTDPQGTARRLQAFDDSVQDALSGR